MSVFSVQSLDHRRLSFETLQRDFELSDCLRYIKAGVESIIEDEVTQCFEAEELKVGPSQGFDGVLHRGGREFLKGGRGGREENVDINFTKILLVYLR